MFSRKSRSLGKSPVFREPKTRFAIVGNPRTGSSHLASLLDSHPDVACWDDEIFDVNEAYEKSGLKDPHDFLQQVVLAVNADAVGFKLLWDAMERLPNVWQFLRETNVKLVHTYRTNQLDSFISHRLATINHAFTCWYGDYKTTKFEADFAECLDWFKSCEDHDRMIERQAFEESVPRLAIEYNQLCKGQDTVLDFLGAAKLPLTSQLKKQRSGRQSEIVTNYELLKKKFENSPWIAYFED